MGVRITGIGQLWRALLSLSRRHKMNLQSLSKWFWRRHWILGTLILVRSPISARWCETIHWELVLPMKDNWNNVLWMLWFQLEGNHSKQRSWRVLWGWWRRQKCGGYTTEYVGEVVQMVVTDGRRWWSFCGRRGVHTIWKLESKTIGSPENWPAVKILNISEMVIPKKKKDFGSVRNFLFNVLARFWKRESSARSPRPGLVRHILGSLERSGRVYLKIPPSAGSSESSGPFIDDFEESWSCWDQDRSYSRLSRRERWQCCWRWVMQLRSGTSGDSEIVSD